MPKTIFTKPPDRLKALLLGYADAQGLGVEDLGRILGCVRQTAAKKLESPTERLNTTELVKLGRGLNIPVEELRSAALMY